MRVRRLERQALPLTLARPQALAEVLGLVVVLAPEAPGEDLAGAAQAMNRNKSVGA